MGRIRALTPILRLSIAYPLRNRFRTGITLAMFMLVVFTLVVGGTISGSFVRAFDNEEMFGGGFDVRASSAAISPIDDPCPAIANAPELRASDYRVVSAQSYLPVQARQTGAHASTFENYPVRGVDTAFRGHTTYLLAAHARGYPTPWRALATEPGPRHRRRLRRPSPGQLERGPGTARLPAQGLLPGGRGLRSWFRS